MISRLEISSRDPSEFAELISPFVGGPGISATALRSGRFSANSKLTQLEGAVLGRIRCRNLRAICDANADYLRMTIPLSSPIEVGKRRRELAVDVMHVDAGFDMRLPDSGHFIGMFRVAALRQAAAKMRLESADRVLSADQNHEFDMTLPRERRWLRSATSLWNQAWRDGPITRSPLATREATQSLLSGLAEILAGSDMPTGQRRDSARTLSGVLRAENWISAHLADPVSRADLCEVSGLTLRTLTNGFRRRHGIGPMAFIRMRRLDRVHLLLLASEPDEVNVTRIALDHGFCHLSRFAGDYRRAFGESPSETLRLK